MRSLNGMRSRSAINNAEADPVFIKGQVVKKDSFYKYLCIDINNSLK